MPMKDLKDLKDSKRSLAESTASTAMDYKVGCGNMKKRLGAGSSGKIKSRCEDGQKNSRQNKLEEICSQMCLRVLCELGVSKHIKPRRVSVQGNSASNLN